MKSFNNKITSATFLKFSVFGILLLRLILNALVPLMDKTEARYSEIGRLMAETENWITPQIDYGVPFWAKPPMSTWFTAFFIKIFGENEFGARFSSFLIAIAVILLVSRFVAKDKPKYLAAFILLTLPEFLLHAGVVSTDMSLLICIVLMMLSFWEIMNNGKKIWGYLFFVAAGFGFLAKGPIVLLLTFPPLIIWTFLFKQWSSFFFKLPWILGILLMIAISLPWYYFAEKETPGFLDYFFVGEHFKRYTDPDWKGDKYGFPKIQPLGIIWAFLVAFALPWIVAVFYQLWKDRKSIFKNKWVAFLVFWAFWTPAFFTISKSLIHTYTLPSMPALALIVVYYWDKINKPIFVKLSLILPIVAALILVTSPFTNAFQKLGNTDKFLISSRTESEIPLYGFQKKAYSAQFYSHGKIVVVDLPTLEQKIISGEKFHLIIEKKEVENLSEIVKLSKIVSENKKKMILEFD